MAEHAATNLQAPYKPGQSGNPKGRVPRRPPDAKLRHLLERHLGERVKREIPDSVGRPQVVEVCRLELLVKLMVATVFEPSGDPAFRCQCLKHILARVDPVSADSVAHQLEVVIRRPAGIVFAEHLQRTALRTGTIEQSDIIEALGAGSADVDFNGVKDGNGDNGNERLRLPTDNQSGD